jgi:predicted nucleic acid-binding protein
MSPVQRAPLSRVFVDSSAYYALTDQDERTTHHAAMAIRDRLIRDRTRLFTTNFVLAETHALILVRLGRHIAARVLQEIDRSTTTILRVTVADEHRARDIVYRYRDKNFSLTDATSFAAMERLGIGSAFSFDRNFTQYGFQSLSAQQ